MKSNPISVKGNQENESNSKALKISNIPETLVGYIKGSGRHLMSLRWRSVLKLLFLISG